MATQTKKVASSARARTKLRIRKKVQGTIERPRLTVFRSSKHMYAQLIADDKQTTLAAASTRDKDVAAALAAYCKETGVAKASLKSVHAAKVVGKLLASRGKAAQVSSVVFDRNGFMYCGRVQALADGAREGGLQF
jgi:large subunit ribosomal protein L18